MEGFEIISEHYWYPFAAWGLKNHLLRVNVDTVMYTWCVLGIIGILAFAGRLCVMYAPHSIPGYLVQKYVRLLKHMLVESCHTVYYRYLLFFVVLCTFLLVCNTIVIIPYTEEPTKDLNTAFALGIITFLFIQREMIRQHGVMAWVREYFKMPLSVSFHEMKTSLVQFMFGLIRCVINLIIGSILLPIELVSKLSSVFSLSFRLFGNIFAGSIIASLWGYLRTGSLFWHILGLVTGFNLLVLLFFGVFEGVIQAAVFTMLGVSYLGRAIQTES